MSEKLVRNFIDGRWVKPDSTRTQPVLNPATGEQIASVVLSNAADVDRAVQSAHDAFAEWRETPPYTRARAMFKLKELMEQHFEELAQIVTLENGKILDEARGEVRRAIENVELAAGIPTQMMGYNLEDVAQGIDESAIRQPLGVCVSINPFNFPSMVPLWFMPVAIACGNTYIIKPSPVTPLSQEYLMNLLMECDLPDGVVNLVNGDEEAVNALLDHPLVRAVSFVGSTRVGRAIYERATRNGKRVQAQGGAKNFMVVMPDADINKSIGAIIGSAYGCAGQRCLAGSVLVTVGDVHDKVRDGLIERAGKLKVGPGLDEMSQMGPVISQQSLNRICTFVEKGQSDGAQLLLDGRNVNVFGHERGNFIAPTIFDNATVGMSIVSEEIFGPVLSMMNVPDLDTAIDTLHTSRYGNAAALFTQNGRAAKDFRYKVQAGNIGINVGVPAPVASFPFGGMRESFFGDLHGQGPDGINFFTDRKIIIERWF
jgi:malonate-semialdehyde dehydrogenase (acetylating) / methylmalonate-semialdehyde dehydrogenase